MYDSVEIFVLFVGYVRSGYSFIVVILDFYLEIIILNEFYFFENLNSFY